MSKKAIVLIIAATFVIGIIGDLIGIDGISITFALKFPYAIEHCYYRVWPR